MADKKISALTGATTPLAGTEVLPIVQSGATVKVAVSDLTAGRAVTALTYNGNTITTGTGVLTLAAGKTLTASNTLTLAGTDATTQTFPTTSATIARTDAAQTFTGAQLFTGIVTLNNGARVLYADISPAFNTSATLFIGTNYGIFQISDIAQTGDSALFLISVASGITELFDPANGYSITPGTVASANITYAGGTITVENKLTIGASFKAVWLGI